MTMTDKTMDTYLFPQQVVDLVRDGEVVLELENGLKWRLRTSKNDMTPERFKFLEEPEG